MPAAVCMWNQALSVNSVVGSLRFDRNCVSHWQTEGEPCAAFDTAPDQCGDEAMLDVSWMNELTACAKVTTSGMSECVTKPAGAGIDNVDFVIIVKAADSITCKNSPSTLGYAHACRYDQNDRPILGFINFCPNAVSDADDGTAISTAAHELGHALGFSASTWPSMRMNDGTTPRTSRDESGQPAKGAIKCSNGQNAKDERPAASSTLKRGTSRGNPNTFTLVTPAVREEARRHFGCNTLDGMELENQPTGQNSCWGSHWEQRVLNNELMSPVGGSSAVLSRATLAAFQDMGWYDVNFTVAGELSWGNKMGCEFVNNKCVDSNTGVAMGSSEGYFCTDTKQQACNIDKTSKSVCNAAQYSGNIEPAWFQHFPNDATKGGALAELDYCPFFQMYSNQDCLDPKHAPSQQNARGETYGVESRCFDTTLIQDVYVSSDAMVQTCFKRVCLDSGSVRVFATDANGKEMSIDCDAKDVGSKKSMPSGFNGELVCPDVTIVCRSTRSGLDLPQCRSGSRSTGSTSSTGGSTDSPSDGGGTTSGTTGGTAGETTPSSSVTAKTSMSGGSGVNRHGRSKWLVVVLVGIIAGWSSL